MTRFGAAGEVCSTLALIAVTTIQLAAQSFTTLHSFDSSDGSLPTAGLIQATDGNLYGTTFAGGPGTLLGGGTIFKMTPSGAVTTLFDFGYSRRGSGPASGIIQGTDGNFYGTTSGLSGNGGTVFTMSTTGVVETLYTFCLQSGCADGDQPNAGLLQAFNGNFYGTTSLGGAHNQGTVFEITSYGKLTTLYSFCSQPGCADGAYPYQGKLFQMPDGELYGTTLNGGGPTNSGTIYKITPAGALTTLYQFCSKSGCSDGRHPWAGLIFGYAEDLYGATSQGGTNDNGIIFRITTSGEFTVLHRFNGSDGANPEAALQTTGGEFYGTTSAGGANGGGTIFELAFGGSLSTRYNFCAQANCEDGFDSRATLAQDTNGTFYGTTYGGGASGNGTVFSFSDGLRHIRRSWRVNQNSGNRAAGRYQRRLQRPRRRI